MLLHRPHLTHTQARRVLWFTFAILAGMEACLAFHLLSVHETVAGTLGLTALSRDSILVIFEHVLTAEA